MLDLFVEPTFHRFFSISNIFILLPKKPENIPQFLSHIRNKYRAQDVALEVVGRHTVAEELVDGDVQKELRIQVETLLHESEAFEHYDMKRYLRG